MGKATFSARYADDLSTLNEAGGSFIRLVRVVLRRRRRRKFDPYLTCVVRTFPLDQAPQYSAISYVWPTEKGDKRVKFQGSLHGTRLISSQVVSALWQIQKHRPTEWLWLDAVCIDQSNFAEKNDQVPRMQRIYSSASGAVIWLGSLVSDTGGIRSPTYPVEYSALGLSEDKLIKLAALGDVGRAWWSRVWTIQEMVVAVCAYVCVGPRIMTWEDFHSALPKLRQLVPKFGFGISYHRIHALQRLRQSWRAARHEVDILALLDFGRSSHATNARDHIYGLLGLMASENQNRIVVDYGRSTNSLYAEMTIFLIERLQTLDFLVECSSYKPLDNERMLPSWVFDFCDNNFEQRRPILFQELKIMMQSWSVDRPPASIRDKPSISFQGETQKLHVQGIVLDHVETIAQKLDGEMVRSFKSQQALNAYMRVWIRSAVPILETALPKPTSGGIQQHGLARDVDIADMLLDPNRHGSQGIRNDIDIAQIKRDQHSPQL